MEVKIKSMKHEDFKDNEYIDNLVEQLRAGGTNIIVGKLDQLTQQPPSGRLHHVPGHHQLPHGSGAEAPV